MERIGRFTREPVKRSRAIFNPRRACARGFLGEFFLLFVTSRAETWRAEGAGSRGWVRIRSGGSQVLRRGPRASCAADAARELTTHASYHVLLSRYRVIHQTPFFFQPQRGESRVQASIRHAAVRGILFSILADFVRIALTSVSLPYGIAARIVRKVNLELLIK